MLSLFPIRGLPMLRAGDDLTALLSAAFEKEEIRPAQGDIVVACQKAVSKVEGRVVDLRGVTPSPFALRLTAENPDKDPRIVEVVLRETNRIVRMQGGHLIVETGPGWVCANAGVDSSNSGAHDTVILLPVDPDGSARRLASALQERYRVQVAVLITDTWGRAWRQGLVDFAIGVAGISPLLDLRGSKDLDGRELQHTVVAQADGLAAAAGLLMRKNSGVPVVLIRGYEFEPAESVASELIRPKESDLFR
jgi:coenzyme F420-0:L-glutamate ligase/coenzyme F420-1:gamma-L-glutamate ligase